jgi:GMP synthase-like glutamine amidotransferase
MRIACIRHVPFEGPGAIADWAAARGHALSGSEAFKGHLPALSDFDLLVVLGGPMGVYDVAEHPWLIEEREFLASAIDAGKVVLGVCLGAQLLADAIGGSVHPGPEREIGWFPVRVSAAGRSSALFGGWPDEFVAGHWHGDTFEIPPGVASAASSEVTANQAFVACDGRAVGLQFHLEWTRDALAALVENCADELTGGGRWTRSAEELLADDDRFARSRELLFALLDRIEARA